MHISIQRLREGARLPHRGSDFAAGYDLYAAPASNEAVTIVESL